MPKTFNPTIQVSVFEMMRMKPGDPCPSDDCKGYIGEIRFSWTVEVFTGDAQCNKCGEEWCIAEEVVEEEENNG